jgi:hypothetical protein
VKVVGGQPPQGYERAVIERGEIPDGILDDVSRMEAHLKEQTAATERLTENNGEDLLNGIPVLPSHIRLEQKPILSGSEYKQTFHLVVDSDKNLAHGYPLSPVMAGLIAKMDGSKTMSAIISEFEAEHGVAQPGAIRSLILKDLPPIITIGMLDVTPPGKTRAERRRFERLARK